MCDIVNDRWYVQNNRSHASLVWCFGRIHTWGIYSHLRGKSHLPEGDSHAKRTGVLAGTLIRTPNGYQDHVLWVHLEFFVTPKALITWDQYELWPVRLRPVRLSLHELGVKVWSAYMRPVWDFRLASSYFSFVVCFIVPFIVKCSTANKNAAGSEEKRENYSISSPHKHSSFKRKDSQKREEMVDYSRMD